MLHPKAVDGCGVVVANSLLFGIETDALTDDGGFGACGAPDGEGHFEADGQDALS